MKKLLLTFVGMIVLAMAANAYASSISLDLNEGRIRVKDHHHHHRHHDEIRRPHRPHHYHDRYHHRTVIFEYPAIDGYSIDWCLTPQGHGCGVETADRWCQVRGFRRAARFEVAPYREDRSIYIDSGIICPGGCGVFTFVECK